jgi:hypothetical protein
MEPIKIVLSGTLACDLMRSLTAEEREGITENRTLEGVQLTLPQGFEWVPVAQAAPSLYTYAFISASPKGPKRIQLKYDGSDTIVEVIVLKPIQS